MKTEDAAHALEIAGLSVAYGTGSASARVLNDVDLHISRGETVAVVGESGSGKSTLGLATMGLLKLAKDDVLQGSIRLNGREIVGAPRGELRSVRGREIAMIFQDPLSALNPVQRVGNQIAEMITTHHGGTRRAARARVLELMRLVRIPDPERRVDAFPHQFSGGMRQRILIATALALEPRVIVADEPTTALDATIEGEILDLLSSLQHNLGLALLLITHDWRVVTEVADRVSVMYGGRIIEEGTVDQIRQDALHPYTRALLQAAPSLDHRVERLASLPGAPPSPSALPSGCAFAPRCPLSRPFCTVAVPELTPWTSDHRVACPVVLDDLAKAGSDLGTEATHDR